MFARSIAYTVDNWKAYSFKVMERKSTKIMLESHLAQAIKRSAKPDVG